MNSLSGFSLYDQIAFGIFVTAWTSHFWFVGRSRWHRDTITWRMAQYRERWMHAMLRREVRMVDALIHNNLQQGVLFFGSTSILLIGALIAGLGASDQALTVLEELPFSSTDSRAEWQAKLLLVILIFVFAFFKFAWSLRLFNYVIIVIGAAPERDAQAAELDRYASMTGRLYVLAARHFTIGLHAYFFALAAITWLLSAWVFIGATLWVSAVIYRRAFHSTFLKTLNEFEP